MTTDDAMRVLNESVAEAARLRDNIIAWAKQSREKAVRRCCEDCEDAWRTYEQAVERAHQAYKKTEASEPTPATPNGRG